MLIAFLRWGNCDHHIGIVLDRYQPSNSMANLTIQSVFRNNNGQWMLPTVMAYYRDIGVDIHISLGMLDEALKSHDYFEMVNIVLTHAKTVTVGTHTLQSLKHTPNDFFLMNLLMNHENCEYKDAFESPVATFNFNEHLSTCPVKITKKRMQLAAQLDETALETLQRHIPERRRDKKSHGKAS